MVYAFTLTYDFEIFHLAKNFNSSSSRHSFGLIRARLSYWGIKYSLKQILKKSAMTLSFDLGRSSYLVKSHCTCFIQNSVCVKRRVYLL